MGNPVSRARSPIWLEFDFRGQQVQRLKRLTHHLGGEALHQPAAFGKFDEIRRQPQPVVGIPPSRQHLEPHQVTAADLDDRLKARLYFVPLQSLPHSIDTQQTSHLWRSSTPCGIELWLIMPESP
jgi:hypothetical protein